MHGRRDSTVARHRDSFRDCDCHHNGNPSATRRLIVGMGNRRKMGKTEAKRAVRVVVEPSVS